MKESLIAMDSVSKSFGDTSVLSDLSFDVGPGEILGLIGPNGSGKTTTLRLLNGVIFPDGGQIQVGGYDPVHDGEQIRRMGGILTESAGLYLNMTGLENLRFFAELYDVDEADRPLQLLEAFGLTPSRDRKVGTYSTGMKKRLGLAKALLHRPQILFLDEPTNGLDPEGIRMVLEYIAELNRQEGTTVILCSHQLQQLELVCHRYVFLGDGRVMEQGTLPELEAKYNPTVTLVVETAQGRQDFTLPNRSAVPELLRELTQQTDVYSATPVNKDLESLYFKIQEVHHRETAQ